MPVHPARRALKCVGALLLAMVFAMVPIAAHADETPTPNSTPAASTSGAAIGVVLEDHEGRPASDQKLGPPVPDVRFVVTAKDGTEIGAAVTDADGRGTVPVPDNGTYQVVLDRSTLPAGIDISKAEATKTIQLKLATTQYVQFPINVQAELKKSFGQKLIDSSISGIKFGLIIALAALGLSLIFGTTGLTNFAHGELITFGGLATYTLNRDLGLPVIAAGIIAVFLGAIFGYAQDRALWRPLRNRGTGIIATMIVSIGFALFLRSLFQYFYGSGTMSLTQYSNQSRHDYGFISLAPKEIAIIAIGIVAIVITCIALMKTRLGKAMRAVSDNPALSASSGMRVDGVISSVWVLGTAITALAGVLLAINAQVNFVMGFKLLLLVFAAVTLGGLGTIWGALIGSMIIGIMVEVSPLFGIPSSIKEVGALAVLILILLIRPQGILGRRERIG